MEPVFWLKSPPPPNPLPFAAKGVFVFLAQAALEPPRLDPKQNWMLQEIKITLKGSILPQGSLLERLGSSIVGIVFVFKDFRSFYKV